MQSGIEYHGSVPDQIQQFMVGRGPVHIPSLMFTTLNNQHGHLPSQTKQRMQQPPLLQQQQSGGFQIVQHQGFQIVDSPENTNSHSGLKQKVQGGQEGYGEEDINASGEPGEKNPEANRWPREETLALLRIRAAMDANLKDSNVKGPVWETVSRKLAELGFYRSAKKCKEKFENVNKYYKKTKDGRINRHDGKSYRFFSELEALHAGLSAKNGGIDNAVNGGATNGILICNKSDSGNPSSVPVDKINPEEAKTGIQSSSETAYNSRQNLSSDGTSEEVGERNLEERVNKKKRKRKQKMDTIKAFLENMVKQVMEHQENLQKKFLEAIEKREQDRLQREEAWKRQEMAKLNRETELRAQEHALQSSRETTIIGFLQKFTGDNLKLDPQTMPNLLVSNTQEEGKNNTARENTDPHCKRWPKSEVYALIQLRSDMETRFKESGPKVALWEEISSAMASMGFNRSSKRCKEKWENINKYFRKTKGNSKKRPLNTKTCPYFHHLDALYRKGILLSPAHAKNENKLEYRKSNSDALATSPKDGHEQKNNEGQIDDLNSELLAIIPSSDQESVPTYNTDSTEPMELLTQKRMKWSNQNLIHTMDNQSVALNSRSPDEFSGSSSHSKRFNMEVPVKETTGRQQNQIFFNGSDRREQQQDIADNEVHHRHQQQQKFQTNQVLKPTEEQHHSHAKLSQSALMALVHKLSANYSISPPSSTE